jgi:hypothetical protein
MATGIPAEAAAGTLFQIGNLASPEAWQSVANVSDIGGPNMAGTEVDVTSHTSPSIPWRQKIITLLDIGQCPIKIFWQPTDPTHANSPSSFVGGLMYIFINRVKIPVRFLHPDGTADSFFAYIKDVKKGAPIAGVLALDITLSGTDAPLGMA